MSTWARELSARLRDFETVRGLQPSPTTFSIKIRVSEGCFHREHSPVAYRLIDSQLALGRDADQVELVEHENGPEVLVYAAVVTAGVTLAKSVVDLVTAILKGRSEGIKKGDSPSEPLEVIVRRSTDGSRVDEEIILRVRHTDAIQATEVERRLLNAMNRLRDPGESSRPAG